MKSKGHAPVKSHKACTGLLHDRAAQATSSSPHCSQPPRCGPLVMWSTAGMPRPRKPVQFTGSQRSALIALGAGGNASPHRKRETSPISIHDVSPHWEVRCVCGWNDVAETQSDARTLGRRHAHLPDPTEVFRPSRPAAARKTTSFGADQKQSRKVIRSDAKRVARNELRLTRAPKTVVQKNSKKKWIWRCERCGSAGGHSTQRSETMRSSLEHRC
jgi:hypothetical protein